MNANSDYSIDDTEFKSNVSQLTIDPSKVGAVNSSWPLTATLQQPKLVATITLCGCITISINDQMNWKQPTDEQIKNLKDTFGIEITILGGN